MVLASALVFLASGFEEIEAVTIVDVLRRCSVEVTVADLTPGVVDGAHGIKLAPDATISKVKAADFDALILFMGSSILQPLGQTWMVPLLYVLVQAVDAPTQ